MKRVRYLPGKSERFPREVFPTLKVAFLVFLCALPGVESAESSWDPGAILVRTKRPLLQSEIGSVFGKRQCRALRSKRQRCVYSLSLASKENVWETVAWMRKRPEVLCAEPNYRFKLAEQIPNDTHFHNYQWNLKNTGQFIGGWAGVVGEDIGATVAWETQSGSSAVVVAVVDTGVQFDHPDIHENIWNNPGEIPGNGYDDDNNGYVDDWRGWDFRQEDNYPTDTHSHGTHVSGTIAARGNNDLGVSGVCWEGAIMPLSCFDQSGEATNEDLVEAIYYAVDMGAKVINASWGEGLYSELLFSAVKDAEEAEVVFVAAAGNKYLRDLDQMPFYPACFSLDNIISVAASTNRAKIASFSDQGAFSVDIFAPGEGIYSLWLNSGYGYKRGTSMATPHVSGAAALVWSQFPDASAWEVKARVLGAAESQPDYADRVATGGRLNLCGMFEEDALSPESVTDLRVLYAGYDGVTLEYTVPGDDGSVGKASGVEIRYATESMDEAGWENASLACVSPQVPAEGATQRVTVRNLTSSTEYQFAARIYDNVGNLSGMSNVAVAETAGKRVLWHDNVESVTALWSAFPEGKWTRTDIDANSGTHCWTDSADREYENDTVATLTSTPFSLKGLERPLLAFYHWHDFADSGLMFQDGGQLQISTFSNGGEWETLARFYNSVAPWHRCVISLCEFEQESEVRIRFRLQSNSEDVGDGWYIDDIEVFSPERLAWPEDLFVESKTHFANIPVSASAYFETEQGGAWFNSSSKASRYGLTASQTRAKETDHQTGSTATFVPLFPMTGVYEIFTIWGISANAENVTYRIEHYDGTAEVQVTQHPWLTSNRWISLGSYRFRQGRSQDRGSITVDDSTVTGKPVEESSGRVYADSIRCVFSGFKPILKGNFWQVIGQN